jgi:tRNA U34 5-methylaminomethyl-2-thiouridine-forming methyltransferase MnmC
MSNISIITTSDGSHSLLNKALNETYHSHHGAIQESIHVFIEKGLKYFLERSAYSSVNIFEVGFGTGLNALLTLETVSQSSTHVSYTSIETFPLENEIWSQLNYARTAASSDMFAAIHRADWNSPVQIHPNFELLKMETSLQNLLLQPSFYDLIYFDAFAPNKQPEMWEMPVLEKVVQSMKAGGVFVTYCAKGQLKRDLKTLGLQVETLEGPPGKKEMVRGLKI